MKTPLIIIAFLLIIIGAAAQTPPTKTDGQYTQVPSIGRCTEYRVKMLYAATDPTDGKQAGYLLAAQAYAELEEAGQTC